ncbi:MAG TPA: hypothetical protein VMT31_01405 [Methanomicrobiales archaeon]|jgi:hypothetical protein|nr:hypothetical protein [Methanomicrobiales archaeon]
MNMGELSEEDVWFIGLCCRYGEIFSNKELMEEFIIRGVTCGFLVATQRASGRTMILDSTLSPMGKKWFYPKFETPSRTFHRYAKPEIRAGK